MMRISDIKIRMSECNIKRTLTSEYYQDVEEFIEIWAHK